MSEQVSVYGAARGRRPRPPRVPETAVQQHIAQLLRTLGGRVFILGHPSPNDGRRHRGTGQTAGVPDVIAFLPPRPPSRFRWTHLYIEVKAEGGRLRAEQAMFRVLCQEADVSHITGDLDDVIAWLLEQGYLHCNQVAHYRIHEQETT